MGPPRRAPSYASSETVSDARSDRAPLLRWMHERSEQDPVCLNGSKQPELWAGEAWRDQKPVGHAPPGRVVRAVLLGTKKQTFSGAPWIDPCSPLCNNGEPRSIHT